MKIPLKWALAVAGLALVALAVVVAARDQRIQDTARRASGERLERIRVAASNEVLRAVGEARAALEAWVPEQPKPAIFRIASVSQGDEEAEERIGGTGVTFGPFGAVHVFVDAPSPSGAPLRRRGTIGAEDLRRRIEAAADVGPPGTAWTRIVLAERDGSALLVAPGPELDRVRRKPGERRAREWDRVEDHGGLEQLRRGETGRLTTDGMPQSYKAIDDHRMLGVWDKLEPDSKLRVLAEVEEETALRGLLGTPISWGDRVRLRLNLWYGILAAGLLTVFVSFFLFVAGRYAEIGPLVRVYGFARPYVRGIVGAVAAGGLFSATKMGQTLLLKQFGDDVLLQQGPDARQQLVVIAILTAAIGLIMAVATFFKDFLQNYYSTTMVNDVRLAIGRRLVALPLSFYHRMRIGDLNARIERDVTGMRALLNEVFDQGFVQPFILVGAIVAAFVMNANLAMVLLGMPIVVVPLFKIARKIKKRAEKRQVLIAEISHVTFQILSGIKVIKAFGGERREVDRLAEANRRYIRQVRKIQRLAALSKGLMDLLQMAGGAALVYFGGLGVLEGGVTLGDLFAFMLVVQLVYNAAKELTGTFNKVIEGTPAVLRVFEVLDAPDTLTDGPRTLAKVPLRRGIELRGLRFRYLETEVLRGIDLVVPAGKVVALVGPTGAGKTTVCDLVARFYDPTEGAVLYDGVDVREYTKKSLVESIAIVTQDAFLFNTTIEENIRYGREDATREHVEAAARDAFVHDDIVAMDGGYAKLAGERGTSLSGGQRQRITIARAILKDAPVLILDEATSNLDSRSESKVQAALAKLMAGRTVIVVAHRLSTIRNADRIVVLEGGAIVEEGTPAELLANPKSRFKAMYDLQMGERRKDEGGEDAEPVA